MNITYRPSMHVAVDIDLGDDSYVDGGLLVKRLQFSEKSIFLDAHLILGDGTIDPRVRRKRIAIHDFMALPEWVQDLHDQYLQRLAEAAGMIENYFEEPG